MGSMGLPWLLLLLLVQTITVFMGEVDGTSPSLSRHHLPPPPLHNPLHLSHQNRPPSPLPVPRHYHLPPTPHNPHLSQQDPPPPPPHILSLLQQHLSSHLPRHILPARVQEHHDQLHPASLHAAWPRDVDTGMRTNRRDVEKGDRAGGKVTNYCDVCPAAHAIAPCMCECMNSTVAELTCGSSLGSCTQLTDILTIQDFPTNYYIRLIVDGTTLGCTLEQGLWGPIKYQEILLTNNHFNTLDNHAFTPFNDTLKLLNLEKNSLENVYFPTLSELSHLEVLSLSYNKISFIPSFSPICLNRLRKLKLGYNSIQFLQQRTFADLPSLVYLDLSHNLISELPSEAFTIPGHQSNLVLQIDLAFNAISRVEYGVLDGPTSCVLYLQHNQLETLEQHAFMSIIDSCSTSAMIIVTGNPLTCDQRLCWLVLNETIRASFDDFPCPNLNNNQVDVILPLCQVLHRQL